LGSYRRCAIYAIVETGGKQYKVAPGQVIDVERLDVAEGETVDLDKVLLLADNDEIIAGKPAIEGAKVIATSRGDGRSKKVIVFKYKPKTRYRKKTGHRQAFTKLAIDNIIMPGKSGEPTKKVQRRKKEVVTDGA